MFDFYFYGYRYGWLDLEELVLSKEAGLLTEEEFIKITEGE